MAAQQNEQIDRLNRLLSSGAITRRDYDGLIAALSRAAAPEEPPFSMPSNPTHPAPHQGQHPQRQSLLGLAAAAGGGALAGSLAADMIRASVAQPEPQMLEAHMESSTTWSEDGFVTEGEIVWANEDGDVVAVETYEEEVSFDDSDSTLDVEAAGDLDGDSFDGGSFDGLDF